MPVEVTQFYPEYLSWLALCNNSGCQSYLEIGTESGASIVMAARLLSATRVATVDIGSPHQRHYHQRVRYFVANSHLETTRDLILSTLGLEAFDAVFVDGDHSYEGVQRDFTLWWPVTRKVMGFHDIVTHNLPELHRFWGEISRDRPAVEFLIPRAQIPHRTCGIGVLFQEGYLPGDALEDLFAHAGGKYAL